jgi:hypothetical protein
MRNQLKTRGLSAEIRETDGAEYRDLHEDFRTWWKANVRESRYWGGGPDGRFADSGKYGPASAAR